MLSPAIRPVIVPVKQETAVIRITPMANLQGMHTFTIRATAMQEGKYPVISETKVVVELLPSATESVALAPAREPTAMALSPTATDSSPTATAFSPVAAGLEFLDFLDAEEARARLRILGPAKLSSTDIGIKRRDRDAQHLGRFLRVDEIRRGCM